MIAAMARLSMFPTRSVTFPGAAVGVAVTIPATGPGVMVAFTIGRGVIVATIGVSTMGVAAAGAGDAVGTGIGEGEAVGEGVGHGTSVALGVGDGRGDGDAAGVGVCLDGGHGVMSMIVGTGRGVVIGSREGSSVGQPVGNRAMLRAVRSLIPALTSISAMGRTYIKMPTKQMMAIKFSSALYIGSLSGTGRCPTIYYYKIRIIYIIARQSRRIRDDR